MCTYTHTYIHSQSAHPLVAFACNNHHRCDRLRWRVNKRNLSGFDLCTAKAHWGTRARVRLRSCVHVCVRAFARSGAYWRTQRVGRTDPFVGDESTTSWTFARTFCANVLLYVLYVSRQFGAIECAGSRWCDSMVRECARTFQNERYTDKTQTHNTRHASLCVWYRRLRCRRYGEGWRLDAEIGFNSSEFFFFTCSLPLWSISAFFVYSYGVVPLKHKYDWVHSIF